MQIIPPRVLASRLLLGSKLGNAFGVIQTEPLPAPRFAKAERDFDRCPIVHVGWMNKLCLCDFYVHSSSGKEAGTAVHRAALGGVKRYRRLLSALSALDGNFDALSYSRRLRGCNRSQSFVFRLLARLAALWFVFEPFIVKENLLAGSPNEILVTVYTSD